MFPLSLLLLLPYVESSFVQASASSFSNEIAIDRDALLQFKASLGNQSGALVSWNMTTSDFCHWPGVSCSHRHKGRVSALNLSSAGLVGSISPSIANLTFLKILDLSYNLLQGEIPWTIGRLSRLQYVNFTANSLHGEIPVSLSNCTGLINIMLERNHLSGEIPTWLGGFPKLVALLLTRNNLTGSIPPSLGNLSSLEALYVQYNQLTGSIPEELGKLTSVQWLALFANRLSGTIPEAVFNLSSVIAFGVDQNDLHGTLSPTWGQNSPNLELIYFSVNHFTGSVPASLANATMIHTLDLGDNSFTGKIPPVIGTLCPGILTLDANQIEASRAEGWEFITHLTNCSRLRVLSFQYNMFAGELPDSIANLSTNLQVLYTGVNRISGRIPPDIGKLVGLQKLQLSQNHFVGDLPHTIGQLKTLQALWVDGNLLSGTIPTSLGNLTQLQIITFDDNKFQGPIPAGIRNLQQLNSANLSHNAFTGPFPSEILNLSSLSYYLDLSDNLFIGPLPPQVASLTKLAYLGISRNNLSGPLPHTLSNCQSLVQLHLDSNSFNGSLPATIGEMRGLVALHLTNNNFSGHIPQELGRMKGLQELYLAHNNLSGQIPAIIQNMTSLYRLDVSFNHLSGQVPLHGVFSNSTGFLFVGNDGLCGGMQELHLPPCPVQSWKHKEMKRRIIIITVISTGILLCLLLAILFYLRRKRAAHSNSTTIAAGTLSQIDDKYPKVSYAELVQGTDGFAATNLIGRGRYGSVYKGRLLLNNAETAVAVKVFDLEQSGSSKSFVAECEALGKIRHRNLLSVITCCSSYDSRQNDFKALVFEFMPNQSLDKWIHNLDPAEVSDGSRPMPGLTLIQRLNIALDVANALNYLHNNCEPPIIHCDLKPGNILLNEDFVACVGDFGLAKILSDSEGEQPLNSKSTSAVRGTIGYVAPEYGEGGQVTPWGDVFSFGVVLLEMFTGKAPTDAMFVDGLTLQRYVEMALPDKLMDVVDAVLVSPNEINARKPQHGRNRGREDINNAIISVTRLALSCCKLAPAERITMRDAPVEMHKIRDHYLTSLTRETNM